MKGSKAVSVEETKQVVYASLEGMVSRNRGGLWKDVTADAFGTACGAQAGLEGARSWIIANQREDGSWDDDLLPFCRLLTTLETLFALSLTRLTKAQADLGQIFIEGVIKGLGSPEVDGPIPPLVEIENSLMLIENFSPMISTEAVRKRLRQLNLVDPLGELPLGYVPAKHSSLSLVLFARQATASLVGGHPPTEGLMKGQLQNGSWGCFVPNTAKVLMVLKNYPRRGASYRRGLSWLRALVNPQGMLPHFGPLDVWGTALPLHYFRLAGVKVPFEDLALGALQTHQLADGGWGFNSEVPVSDCDDTSVVWRIQKGRSPDKGLGRAAKFIRRHQMPDGGIATWLPPGGSSVDVTIHSLGLLKDGESLERAISFLRRKQSPSGAFKAMWHLGDVYSTSHAVMELDGLAETKITNRAIGFLTRAQKQDGGWGTAEETGMALLALLKLGIEGNHVDEAVRFLLRTFGHGEGLWSSPRLWVAEVSYSSKSLVNAPVIAALWLYLKRLGKVC